MKRQIQGIILSLLLVAGLFSSMTLSAISDTEAFGTTRTSVEAGMTYTISTQEELGYFAYLSNNSPRLDYTDVTILLTQDITVTNDYDTRNTGNWEPVSSFKGVFDGDGHTVTINCERTREAAFIGSNDGTIKNLTVAGFATVTADYYNAAGIAATNGGTITNCTNSAVITCKTYANGGGITGNNSGLISGCVNNGSVTDQSNSAKCGGITGYNSGFISECVNNDSVTTGYYGDVGGISGIGNSQSIIADCNNYGNVSGGTYARCGGIAGTAVGSIFNCYSNGRISGSLNSHCGGIAGNGLGTGSMANCQNAGIINGTTKSICGGIMGYNFNMAVYNCNNSGSVSGGSNSECGGIVGHNTLTGSVENSYNTGAVIGGTDAYCGGIAGVNNYTVFNCYNTGTVSGGSRLGAIIGYANQQSVQENCYWLESSAAAGLGRTEDGFAFENLISFDTSGVLSTPVNEETALLAVLNQWFPANYINRDSYIYWTSGSPYPVFSYDPVIMTDSLETGIAEAAYSFQLHALGLESVWALTGGSLPEGLTLSTVGVISGTPTASGEFPITVTAANDFNSDSEDYTLKILMLQTPLTFTGIPTAVTYGNTPFTIGTSGGSGTGELTLGISNETDLSGNSTTGVATIGSSGDVTILKAGTFQITAAKAGDDAYTACSAISEIVTVNKKSVTLSGIGAADKDYDGSDAATITGLNTAVLIGILDGDSASLDATDAYAYFSDSAAGSNKTVTFGGFALTGADAGNYILEQPAPVTVTIRKANPDYPLPGFLTATEGQTLADITLPQSANGVFTFDDPLTTPVGTPGEHNFTVTFTPYDTLNYKTETIIVVIKVKAAATSSSASSAASKPSSNSTPTSSQTNSTASDMTVPQMGSSAPFLPLFIVLLLSSSGFILLKRRKSRITK